MYIGPEVSEEPLKAAGTDPNETHTDKPQAAEQRAKIVKTAADGPHQKRGQKKVKEYPVKVVTIPVKGDPRKKPGSLYKKPTKAR